MNALRASASKADVRLERKLRYEFAKLKAKRQLRSLYRTQQSRVTRHWRASRTPPHLLVGSALGCKLTLSATLKNVNGMNRLGSIDLVNKRLRKVEYNLPWLDGQVELLTKLQLAGTTSLLHVQAPSGP
uniref:Uncharacterized protein n=1 Tax=Hyaloperonospora arabidopsidis (strain Emoy2) TaxID=559515 RepID=M4C1B6_HYAAE